MMHRHASLEKPRSRTRHMTSSGWSYSKSCTAELRLHAAVCLKFVATTVDRRSELLSIGQFVADKVRLVGCNSRQTGACDRRRELLRGPRTWRVTNLV